MRSRTSTWIVWSLGTLWVVLLAPTLLLFTLNLFNPEVEVYGLWVQGTFGGVIYPAIGLFLASRRPEHPIGWLFCAAGLLVGVGAVRRPDRLLGAAVSRRSSTFWTLATLRLARRGSGHRGGRRGSVVARTDLRSLPYREPLRYRGLGERRRSGPRPGVGVLGRCPRRLGNGLSILALPPC